MGVCWFLRIGGGVTDTFLCQLNLVMSVACLKIILCELMMRFAYRNHA